MDYTVFTYQGWYCSEPPLAFPWTEVSKAAKMANGIGSKQELATQSFCPGQISVYFPVHSRICPRMHNVIAVYMYTCIHNVGQRRRGFCTLVPSYILVCS